jgi:hypothetical protein
MQRLITGAKLLKVFNLSKANIWQDATDEQYFTHNLVAGAVHIDDSSIVGVNDTNEKNRKYWKTDKM